MKLCVLGLGYIGLPTAVMFAKHGLQVHGVDVSEIVVKKLQNKELHIEEPGLYEMFAEVTDSGAFTVSQEPVHADAYIIAVPTPINKNKTSNLDYVRSATEMIVPYVQEGNLVVLESTSPPKTVENIMLPVLEKTGLKFGEELFVSHSPERVLPGKLFEELVSNDRIVGGINEESSNRTVELYRTFVKGEIHVTDATTAEMVKLMENTYRDVNIAFANELARIAEEVGFNVWEAIKLANCHPRVNIHMPGPGVGGHCIAVDPWFIVEAAPEQAKLTTLSRKINDETPHNIVNIVKNIVGEIAKPKVSVFGLSFKGNIDDMRESPSLEIIEDLVNIGYDVSIYDPHILSSYPNKVDTLEEAVDNSDCVVILTDHNEYKEIDYTQIKEKMSTPNIIDTRNILNKEVLQEAGFDVFLVGDKSIRNSLLAK
ncbi:nucleotide sugar dehydrogenase [Metabacillus halosaccharovorans]|uniref:nucleotide sugar dehydrogenase n=1 Tax=Metabacillus halosaccharovorans TaxID=930124 RepID=UPI00203F20C5|nr:nucleotide sugar dehydrogenase [Metabacillus halosaccharovorans]MCM3443787.1 nucleotide sugar dehydrogenase [Metabacillus halosaccharovorans]